MKYLAQYFIYLAAAFSQLLIKKQNRAWSLALGGGKWNREGGIICVEFLLNSLIRGFRKSRARSWIKLDFIPPELNFRVWIYTISDMEACLSNNCCIFFTIKAWRPFTSRLKLIRPWHTKATENIFSFELITPNMSKPFRNFRARRVASNTVTPSALD